jgi:hypothetical protein
MRPRDVSLFEVVGTVEAKDLTTLTDAQVAALSPLQQKLRDNLIAFDYIYTGKNIDILEFEMKMNMGLAYLQIATTNNTLKEQAQAVPTAVKHISAIDVDGGVGTRFGGPTQIPVYFGTQIRAPSARNTQILSKKAEAAYSLNKHASLEVQDVTMRIYGNPYLVSTINWASSPHNIGKQVPRQPDTAATRKANFFDWSKFPSFAKVNIKVPRNNDDISLFKGESTTSPEARGGYDFTRDFWFTGFYYVVTIEHMFDGGEFTQELSLIGIPESKAVKAVNRQGRSGVNETDATLQKTVLECYDSRVNPCAANQTGLQAQPTAGERVARNKECPPGQQAKPTAPKVCTEVAPVTSIPAKRGGVEFAD